MTLYGRMKLFYLMFIYALFEESIDKLYYLCIQLIHIIRGKAIFCKHEAKVQNIIFFRMWTFENDYRVEWTN